MRLFDLPKSISYKSRDKDYPPILKFYDKVKDKIEKEEYRLKGKIDVTVISVNPEDAEKIKSVNDKWVEENSVWGRGSKRLASDKAFIWLCYGPREQDKIPKGKFHIDHKLIKKI